jgi:membrane protein required for colicin V production
MSFLDIVLGSLLCFSVYKGIKNGLFVELASFISLLVGIYIALQFSGIMRAALQGWVHCSPHLIQGIAFVATFVVVVLGIYLLAKFLTKIADLAFLGSINNLGGGFFRLLKTVLIISMFLTIFEKINVHHYLAKKETLDQSIFFNPIQKVAGIIFPSITRWYDHVKTQDSKKQG